MKIWSVEITQFRGIRRCQLAFGPGLNVLHGPNDLGKSTLADALRAALLVVPGSAPGKEFVPWGGDAEPEVIVVFEQGEATWRLTKKFSSSARGPALLERASASGTWVEELRGRGVDGRLREMLAWGLAAPGGKGRGQSETFLTTALLAHQAGVEKILELGLDGDQEPTGRGLITAALDALGQDPRVTRLIAHLDETLERSFTKTGLARRTPDAPLAKQLALVQEQEQALELLEGQRVRMRDVEVRVRALRAVREAKEESRDEARRHLAALLKQDAAARARAGALKAHAEAQGMLAQAQAREVELAACEVQWAAQDAESHAEEEALLQARAEVAALEAQHMDCAQALTRAKGERDTALVVAEAERARRETELRHALGQAEQRVALAENALQEAARAEALSASALALEAQVARAQVRVSRADALNALARLEGARDAGLALVATMTEAERACVQVQQREAEARAALEQTAQVLHAAELEHHDAAATLETLTSGASQRALALQTARAELAQLDLHARAAAEREARLRAFEAKVTRREALAAEVAEQAARQQALHDALDEAARQTEQDRAQLAEQEGVTRYRAFVALQAQLTNLRERRESWSRRRAEARLRREEASALDQGVRLRRSITVDEETRVATLVEARRQLDCEAPLGPPFVWASAGGVGAVAGVLAALAGWAIGGGGMAAVLGLGVLGIAAVGFALFDRARRRRASMAAWAARKTELDQRWARDAEPLLHAAGVSSVDALRSWSRETEVLRARAREAQRACEALEDELQQGAVSAERIEELERGCAAAERALGEPTAELARRSAALGEDAEVATTQRALSARIERSTHTRQARMESWQRGVSLVDSKRAQFVELQETLLRDEEDLGGPVEALRSTLAAERARLHEAQARASALLLAYEADATQDEATARARAEALCAQRDRARTDHQRAAVVLTEARDDAVVARTRREAATTAAAGVDDVALAGALEVARQNWVVTGAHAEAHGADELDDVAVADGATLRARHEALRTELETQRALASEAARRADAQRQSLGAEAQAALDEARRDAAAVRSALSAMDAPSAEVGAPARVEPVALEARRDALNTALAAARASLREHETTHGQRKQARDVTQGQLQALRRAVDAVSSAELAMTAAAAQRALDPAPEDPVADATSARPAASTREQEAATLDEAEHALSDADGQLREAQGQLQLLGGAVLEERCHTAQERLARLREQHRALEEDLRAHQLLSTALKRCDAERSAHLGRALAEPISERFAALARGRYGAVRLDGALRAEGVDFAGSMRALDRLSVGTRDQLATLLRLAIAQHLRSTLLLDDQLVHSDEARMRWFREELHASALSGLQILVLTCRPSDYLEPAELAGEVNTHVRALDLGHLIEGH